MLNSNETSLSDMREGILNLKEPVVFKNGVADWKLLKWGLKDWAKVMKNTRLPFRIGNKSCSQNPQWEGKCRNENLSFNEFIQRENKKPSEEWMYFDYKYMHQWFEDSNEILKTISWETFGFPELSGEDSTIWLGTEGSHTPCHYDTYSLNIVAQIYGKKMWIMFPPENTSKLQPKRVPYEESSVYSSINFSCGHSNFRGIENAYYIILEPGDVLIVPNQWWHYVENVTTAISINTWVPLKTDDDKRLEECLVRNFISSSIRNLLTEEQEEILNPNERTITNEIDSIDLKQLDICIKLCKTNYELNKTSNNKKDIKSLLDSDKYPNIQTINKLPMEELIEILKKKCKCDGLSKIDNNETKTNNVGLIKYINAFCHPNVISIVKEQLLNTN